MDRPSLRLQIQGKLAAGRLPHDDIVRPWSGPGHGETCDACGEIVTKTQVIMEGLDTRARGIQFHLACFYLWDVERQVPRHAPSARLPARSAFRAQGAHQRSPAAPPARPADSASP